MARIDWNEYFMLQAMIVSSRSTCDRASVGCVLVRDKRVIATGYNGALSGLDDCDTIDHYLRNGHCVRTMHSEANAIAQCARFGISCNKATAYVTHFPCLNCTKALIQSGITKIVYYYNYRVDSFAVELLKESNVEAEKYNNKLNFDDIEKLFIKKN